MPATVLVHGSGPQPRDQPLQGQLDMAFGFEVPVLRERRTGHRRHPWRARRVLLVLGGTMDTNVPPSELALWRDALASSSA